MKSTNEKKQNKKRQQSNPGGWPQVGIPYVKKASETIARPRVLFNNHQVPVKIRPVSTLKRMPVHPNDEQEKEEKTDCV